MYFITVLINLTLAGAVPTHGWMQDVQSFETREECQETILSSEYAVNYSVHEWTDGLGTVDMISCFSVEEWFKLNVELGHKLPERKLNNSSI